MAVLAALLIDSVALLTSSSIFLARSVTVSVADDTALVAPVVVSVIVLTADEAASVIVSVMLLKKQFAPRSKRSMKITFLI